MPGPWDGPVRVIERTPTCFRLATLEGHLEAGQILFSARGENDRLVFWIEAWARSADRLSHLLYHHLRMSKEIQFHMWTSFLEGVIKLSGGRRDGGLRIHTRRVDDVPEAGWRALGDPRAVEALRRTARQASQLRPDPERLRHGRVRLARRRLLPAASRGGARTAAARRAVGAIEAADARLRVRRPRRSCARSTPRTPSSKGATCCSRSASGGCSAFASASGSAPWSI